MWPGCPSRWGRGRACGTLTAPQRMPRWMPAWPTRAAPTTPAPRPPPTRATAPLCCTATRSPAPGWPRGLAARGPAMVGSIVPPRRSRPHPWRSFWTAMRKKRGRRAGKGRRRSTSARALMAPPYPGRFPQRPIARTPTMRPGCRQTWSCRLQGPASRQHWRQHCRPRTRHPRPPCCRLTPRSCHFPRLSSRLARRPRWCRSPRSPHRSRRAAGSLVCSSDIRRGLLAHQRSRSPSHASCRCCPLACARLTSALRRPSPSQRMGGLPPQNVLASLLGRGKAVLGRAAVFSSSVGRGHPAPPSSRSAPSHQGYLPRPVRPPIEPPSC
mmetsp:Transcript_41008/g.106112  ORF Transcript_41008/g.106112 Transcript_41008/m.106112 type:complete len:326 (-) Transcript_41008:141-1118(-)